MNENELKPGFVQIPEPTLNSLKKLLFSKNGGVDLTPIIEDVLPVYGDENKEMAAISVGLAFVGIKPDIDKQDRRSDIGELLHFVRYSQVLGMVEVINMDRNGEHSVLSYSQWMELHPIE